MRRAATPSPRPGSPYACMSEHMEKLDRAGVNIKYSYAYALGSGAEAILVFSFDDNAKAEAALA